MPVQYSSAVEEHNAVRNHAGLFDVSHMGEFRITGSRSREFLQSLIPTSMNNLKITRECILVSAERTAE